MQSVIDLTNYSYNEIDDIIIDIITEFDDSTLEYLFLVNKKLYSVIMKYFIVKITPRYLKCVSLGETTDLNTFCSNFMRQTAANDVNNLEYAYCHDCGLFGKQEIDNRSYGIYKYCKYSCLITCCGIEHMIPAEYDDDIKLLCGCYVTHKSFVPDRCSCNKKIICGRISKCIHCGKIPLRMSEVPLYSSTSFMVKVPGVTILGKHIFD